MTPSRLAFLLTAAGLAAGLAAQLVGLVAAAALAWAVTTALALVPLAYTVMLGLFRGGKAGVDFIALLAMGGALILHEYLAGAVIALMLTRRPRTRGLCHVACAKGTVRSGTADAPNRPPVRGRCHRVRWD